LNTCSLTIIAFRGSDFLNMEHSLVFFTSDLSALGRSIKLDGFSSYHARNKAA